MKLLNKSNLGTRAHQSLQDIRNIVTSLDKELAELNKNLSNKTSKKLRFEPISSSKLNVLKKLATNSKHLESNSALNVVNKISSTKALKYRPLQEKTTINITNHQTTEDESSDCSETNSQPLNSNDNQSNSLSIKQKNNQNNKKKHKPSVLLNNKILKSISENGIDRSISSRSWYYREKVSDAFRDKKIFIIYGGYGSVRRALIKRGWVEKLPYQLRAEPYEILLQNARPGNDYERALLSHMVQHYPANFVWQPRKMKDNYAYISPYRNRIRRSRYLDFTTKEGLIGCIERAHWNIIENVSEVHAPRCYCLSRNDGHFEFLRNYRTTYCISLLLFVTEKSNQKTPENNPVFSESRGTVPMSDIHFAIDRIEKEMICRENGDIDSEQTIIKDKEDGVWKDFIRNVNLLTNGTEVFAVENRGDITPITLACKNCLHHAQKYWPRLQADGYRNLWIVKPGFLCRGNGIVIRKDFAKIIDLSVRRSNLRYIVQKYIERPLLIYKTKFDIRQYMLLSINETHFNIWMYRDCYLRFSSSEFNLDELTRNIHLTNNSIQKKLANGIRSEKLPNHNMWNLKQFKDYLNSTNRKGIWDLKIYPKMKQTCIAIALASLEETTFIQNAFEIYGCDFIIDSEYNPALLEINRSPDFSHSTVVTTKLCPAAIEDLIKVIVDLSRNKTSTTGLFEHIYAVKLPNDTVQDDDMEITGTAINIESIDVRITNKKQKCGSKCSVAEQTEPSSIVFKAPLKLLKKIDSNKRKVKTEPIIKPEDSINDDSIHQIVAKLNKELTTLSKKSIQDPLRKKNSIMFLNQTQHRKSSVPEELKHKSKSNVSEDLKRKSKSSAPADLKLKSKTSIVNSVSSKITLEPISEILPCTNSATNGVARFPVQSLKLSTKLIDSKLNSKHSKKSLNTKSNLIMNLPQYDSTVIINPELSAELTLKILDPESKLPIKDQLFYYREKALKAFRNRQIFTLHSDYNVLRAALIERGWIEKSFKFSNAALRSEPFEGLLAKAKRGNKYEKAILSLMVEHYPSNFIWQSKGMRNNYAFVLPYRNRIRIGDTLNFTTKEGFKNCLERSHWFSIEGIAEIDVPKHFRLNEIDEFKEFLQEFRTNYCLSLLVFIIEKSEEIKCDKDILFSEFGTVSLSEIRFAMNCIEREIELKVNDDLDEDYCVGGQERDISRWNKFYNNANDILRGTKKFRAHLSEYIDLAFQVKNILNEIEKKYWPNVKSIGYYNLWILKPINLHHNKEIILRDDINNIRSLVTNRNDMNYIAQKYIERPLLINNTKFDVRLYMLLQVTKNKLRIWIYKDCFLRFCLREFNLDDLNKKSHLTHYKHSRQIELNSNERRIKNSLPSHKTWHLNKFNEYLRSQNQSGTWDIKIYPQIKQSLIAIILSSLDEMDFQQNTFEIYGCDFIIDEDYNPILIKINSSPDMSFTTDVTKEIHSELQNDIIRVIIDSPQKPTTHTGRFEINYELLLQKCPDELNSPDLTLYGNDLGKNMKPQIDNKVNKKIDKKKRTQFISNRRQVINCDDDQVNTSNKFRNNKKIKNRKIKSNNNKIIPKLERINTQNQIKSITRNNKILTKITESLIQNSSKFHKDNFLNHNNSLLKNKYEINDTKSLKQSVVNNNSKLKMKKTTKIKRYKNNIDSIFTLLAKQNNKLYNDESNPINILELLQNDVHRTNFNSNHPRFYRKYHKRLDKNKQHLNANNNTNDKKSGIRSQILLKTKTENQKFLIDDEIILNSFMNIYKKKIMRKF